MAKSYRKLDRRFGDKIYELDNTVWDKRSATEYANKRRKQGYLVRVVLGKLGDRGTKTRSWNIYIRKQKA